ncbi:MAG TPA: efflux transporter periplasmic adaptor subunit [Xanthomonadales bacterium]|nr:efflux transporter periplasmic adaptor subunit [Xanthomonadales bacterium]
MFRPGHSQMRPTLLAASLALLLTACGGGSAPDTAAESATATAETGKDAKDVKPVAVEAAAAGRRGISASYAGTASLVPVEEAMVVAKTSGVLDQLLAEEGDQVVAGQLLARLDPDRKGLALAQQRATLKKLESEFARSSELYERQLVSADAHEKIRSELDIQRAAVDIAELELSYTRILAPISGVVAERMVKQGNLIQANGSLFRIVDGSRLEAVLNVPERDLAKLAAGLPVALAVDAVPGRRFPGRIDRVSPVVDAGSGTFRVVARFEDQPELRAGMFGRIEVEYDQRADALTIPREALIEGEGETAVFAIRDGKAARVAVEVGYLDGGLAEIRSGLVDGEQVVTVGKATLRDGATVEIVNAPAVADDESPEGVEAGLTGGAQAAAQ